MYYRQSGSYPRNVRIAGNTAPMPSFSNLNECIGDLALVEDSEGPQTQIAGANPVCRYLIRKCLLLYN